MRPGPPYEIRRVVGTPGPGPALASRRSGGARLARVSPTRPASHVVRDVARWLLAAFLLTAGTSHLTGRRAEFQAQVPTWISSWLPGGADLVVVGSGVVEVVLGVALLVVRRRRAAVGWVVAAFLLAVFPGNVSQWVTGTDAFGLDTDRARFVRLFFQPLLIAWALWCTGAWSAWRDRRAHRS